MNERLPSPSLRSSLNYLCDILKEEEEEENIMQEEDDEFVNNPNHRSHIFFLYSLSFHCLFVFHHLLYLLCVC